MMQSKTLWTVKMPTAAAEAQLLSHAQAAGCNGVAIRTSNPRLIDAIARFHSHGIKVYGWRWPACRPGSSVANYYAPDQARYIAEELIPAGLDGFFADIESDNDGGLNDWDDSAFDELATQFCQVIKSAAPDDFQFSLTAGCAQPTWNKHIPWQQFGAFCDYVMPQTYWRWLGPTTGSPENINGGTPNSAFAKAEGAWGSVFPGKQLVPIMGELIFANPNEILQFGQALKSRGVNHFHAYTEGNEVPVENLAAIAAI